LAQTTTTDAVVSAPAPVATGSDKRFAWTIILGHALKHIYISAFSAVLLPEIKLSMNLSNTQVGTMASVQQFSSWASTVTSGYLGDRFISKTAFMLGLSLAMTGGAYFILGLATTYAVLLPAMLLVGLGPSIYHPPAIGALSRRFSSRRAFFISLHGAGGSLGEVMGPLIAAGLLALLFWRDLLQLSLLPALIGAFVMWTLLKNEKSAAGGASSLKEYLGAFFKLLKLRTIQLIYAATAFRTVGQATTIVFLPIYMREELGYTAALVGIYMALAQVVGVGSQPVMGFLADRIGYKRVLVPALAAFALLLLLIPAADGKLQLAIVVVLLGTFLFSLHAILISAATELAGEAMQSTAVSLIYAASFVGALSPTVAGIIGDSYGLRSVFVFSFGLVAISALILALTNLPGARAKAAG
jgi:MFS transporter, FSR family, fosmidomycin resistance protein